MTSLYYFQQGGHTPPTTPLLQRLLNVPSAENFLLFCYTAFTRPRHNLIGGKRPGGGGEGRRGCFLSISIIMYMYKPGDSLESATSNRLDLFLHPVRTGFLEHRCAGHACSDTAPAISVHSQTASCNTRWRDTER